MDDEAKPLVKKEKLKFLQIEQDNVFFKDALSDEFKGSRYAMPDNVRQARNIAIILGFIEIVCCVLSVPFYMRRKSRAILALIIIAFLASAFGMWAKLRLSFWGLAVHATFTIAVIGGFYIYTVIEMCMGIDSHQETGGMNEQTILVLMSLPLLFIFIMGIYSLVLLIYVDDELESRKVHEEGSDGEADDGGAPDLARKEHIIELLQIDEKQLDKNECIICLDRPKDNIFYPCGHKQICGPCGRDFMAQARHKVCPVCRNRVQDIIRVYE